MTRRTALILLILSGSLLAALVAFNMLVSPPEVTAAGIPMARSGSVVGQVEVRRAGLARWAPLQVGEVLSEGDEVRTALFSEVVLHLKGKSSVVVAANSDFVIGEDLVQLSSFQLGVGQITAAIPVDAQREYQFRSRGSDAVATSTEGEFSVATDGAGTVVVDTRAGDVKLKAKGQEVRVHKGRRSIVLPDREPSRVLPIPTSVALQVRWPPTKIDETRTRVTGKTMAGALVMVNGILVRADQQGQFSLDVPLREGSNRLVVNATDPAGNTATRESPEILVDTQPPDLQVDAKDLWK